MASQRVSATQFPKQVERTIAVPASQFNLTLLADAMRRLTAALRRLLGWDEQLTEAQCELVDAVSKWERAECFDCGALFTTEAEAHFHSTHEHEMVLHFYGARLVN